MKLFTDLYTALDETNKTNQKIAAMAAYFEAAPPVDAAWAVYFLSGSKPRQIVPARALVDWAVEAAELPGWLFSESYSAVGDMAETITLLLPETRRESTLPLHTWVEERLLPLRGQELDHQQEAVRQAWKELSTAQRFVYNKLITGAFRVGVSQRLVTRALAEVSGIDSAVVAHRLMGTWEPTPDFFRSLISTETGDADISRPYPFFLAYPLSDEGPETLPGSASDWQVEWKWDGIRSQVIRRQGQVFIWSRGEELISEQYPEITEMAGSLPDGSVLDGEILAWRDGAVLPFAQMQRRIGRKKLTPKMLEEVPVVLMAFDLIEQDGSDIRSLPLTERRARLEAMVLDTQHEHLILSPLVPGNRWQELAQARASAHELNVEGLMLKRHDSPYRVGRQRGDWWKWKVDPYTIDAVLIYAARGSGRRASLYTDYTFGIWDENGQLVPFAKAYSGLTDDEINEVDAFVRANTRERFGPVRTVTPALVFELAFAGVQRSNRHKSGVAVRFPRIQRWRRDKPIEEADTIQTVRALLPEENAAKKIE
jgi:DNA ligase 1